MLKLINWHKRYQGRFNIYRILRINVFTLPMSVSEISEVQERTVGLLAIFGES